MSDSSSLKKAAILAPHEIRERLSSMKEKLDFLRGSL
jgi:hypothetical protein